jgi:hypothetical protein
MTPLAVERFVLVFFLLEKTSYVTGGYICDVSEEFCAFVVNLRTSNCPISSEAYLQDFNYLVAAN